MNSLVFSNMDSKEITAILGRQLFEMGHSPICANFQTIALHECDIISVNSGGNLCEFEIKISASDFKADFKKVFKHTTLKSGPYAKVSKKGEVTHLACSYFTYVCPACLIREDQIPPYAGLIWIHADGRIDHKIKAPMLHKFKADPAIIKKIAHNLTQKQLFGGSHMNMMAKENKERVEGYKADQRRTQFNMLLSLAENEPRQFQKLMIDDKTKKQYEEGKTEFPQEFKDREQWNEAKYAASIAAPIPAPITIPATTPNDADDEWLNKVFKANIPTPIPKQIPQSKPAPIPPAPEPEPELGKRRLVKKTGRKSRR